MNYRRSLTALTAFLLSLVAALTVLAQATTPYVVTSGRSVNARACPQLTCAVVTTFESGEQIDVAEVVTGDAVGGSTDWVRVSRGELGDAYVHRSLVAPAAVTAPTLSATPTTPRASVTPQPSATPEPTAEPEESGGDSSAGGLFGGLFGGSGDSSGDSSDGDEREQPQRGGVDTSDWQTVTTDAFSLSAPSEWVDMRDILEDPEFIQMVAEIMGMDGDEFAETLQYLLDEGLLDLYLFDFSTGATLIVLHEESEGFTIPMSFIRRAVRSNAESTGGEVLSEDDIELAGGLEGVRVHASVTIDVGSMDFENEQLMFGVRTDDRVYYINFSVAAVDYEELEPIFDAVLESFSLLTASDSK